MIQWITKHSPAVITLSVAMISAAVALLVAILSQWALARRGKQELLTKKLEELFVVINETLAHNLRTHAELLRAFRDQQHMTSEGIRTQLDSGFDVYIQLLMFVTLYFPALSHSHERIHSGYTRVVKLIGELADEAPTNREDVGDALSEYEHALKCMVVEMLENRDLLTGSSWFPLRKYKRAKLTNPNFRFPF